MKILDPVSNSQPAPQPDLIFHEWEMIGLIKKAGLVAWLSLL